MSQILLEIDNPTDLALLLSLADRLKAKVVSIKNEDQAGLSTKQEANMLLASQLFEEGRLSSGQAADFVGMDKQSFLEQVGKYGISIFQYDEEELENDLDNAKRFFNHS
ncbi:MAG: UPF0175 family protein [Bacteroidota bacterium]